ncbi:hypothetical protein [Lacrimispora sp.]|uniref:hypothetical protein n=1 Tax=Lacrimispora sp. TaxID=2719234 RepID=UPI003996B0E9
MSIEKVGIVFKEYCSSNKFLKILLPINIPLLFIMAILRNVQNFISMGSVTGTIIYVGFLLSVLLTFAKSEYRMLSIGIGIYAIDYIYTILHSLFKYHRLNWSSIIYLLIWGYFSFTAYKKSLQIHS